MDTTNNQNIHKKLYDAILHDLQGGVHRDAQGNYKTERISELVRYHCPSESMVVVHATVSAAHETYIKEQGGPEPMRIMPLAECVDAALQTALRRTRGEEQPIPLTGRYGELLGGGYWPGMHVLVAGTGSGKTTFVLQAALTAASEGHPVCYVGLELDADQIGLRLLGAHAGRGWSDLYLGRARGLLSDDVDSEGRTALQRLQEQATELGSLPIYTDVGCPAGWAAYRLFEIAEQLKAVSPKVPLIILDFLQLVGDDLGEGKRVDLRERIGRAAYIARQAASQYRVAVLLVSSTSRQNYRIRELLQDSRLFVEEGMGRMHNPDAIVGLGKESGEIEYAADTVTVILRAVDVDDVPEFRVLIPKVRYGRPGWCSMTFGGRQWAEVSTRKPEFPGKNAAQQSNGLQKVTRKPRTRKAHIEG